MNELWKDIKGYENEYQVSNLGNIRSVDRCVKYSDGRKVFYKGKQLKTYVADNGYVLVTLMRKHKGKNYLVHRLVALAFIENPDNLPEINHKDENKLNNKANNLEWCTTKYNRNYGTRNIRGARSKDYKAISEKNKVSQGKRVLQIDSDGNVVKEFLSVRDAERVTGFARQAISGCCNGRYKQAYGYRWCFN